jgi:hypothetical protein
MGFAASDATHKLAEHPFGTLKCRAGYRHFLTRGFDKVRGEWSLMALCYNLSRVAAIVGIGPFIAYLAKRAAQLALLLLGCIIAAVMGGIRQWRIVLCGIPAHLRGVRPPRSRPACIATARTGYSPSLAAKPITDRDYLAVIG